MMAKKTITIYLFATLLFIIHSNEHREWCEKTFEIAVAIADTMKYKEGEANTNHLGVIFSTIDLSPSNLLTAKEIMQKTSYMNSNSDNSFIYLPPWGNKEVIIVLLDDGDFDMYYLCIIDDNGFISVENDLKTLNITPHWFEPGDGENYYYKKGFKIYSNGIIKISTERKEGENSDVQRYTKYYRINENGVFVEISQIIAEDT